MIQYLHYRKPFALEGGGVLPEINIAYHTYGQPDRPVVWVCHALTANSDVGAWWGGLFGPNKLFDPQRYFIVCPNNLGSCYGTTGPLEPRPDTGKPWFHAFPSITIRDMAAAHELLRKSLGIDRVHLLIGGSQGGQQALEWAIAQPTRFDRLALIAANAVHSPWGIAFNESQRMAIENDPTWRLAHPDAGKEGLKTARSIALLSYRHYRAYQTTQTPPDSALREQPPAASYQRYQGDKLARRFNAFSYYTLSKAMDSHHVGRGRPSMEAALQRVQAQTLCISVQSDLLFPPEEQAYLAAHIPNSSHEIIDSAYGHDGFLTETQVLAERLRFFLKNHPLHT